jgi:HD-like signal output (HDOD) protein
MTVEMALTRDAILHHAQTLPAAPQVLGGLCELLQDINTDLDQIADQIRVDSALAARVIRMSNSVGYSGGEPVASVDEAVARVGFAEVVRLVGLATVGGLVERALPVYGVQADKLRESLLLHALAAEALARSLGMESNSAYTAGLLRGLGMMVLDRTSRGRVAYEAGSFANYAEWEAACFGVTATQVTATLLKEWRFPAEVVAALEEHLAPQTSVLAHVLNLAGAVAASRGAALPGETPHWAVTSEKLAVVGLDDAQWGDLVAAVTTTFERQRCSLY